MRRRLIITLLLISFVLTVCGSALSFSSASGPDVRGMVVVGERYLSEERYEEAVAIFTNAIQVEPKYVSAYVDRGTAYIALNQTEEASADYKRAIELDPEQSETLQPKIDVIEKANSGKETDNKTALSDDKLKNLEKLFVCDGTSDNLCFLTCLYDKPEQIDPDKVFYSVQSILTKLTDADKAELINTLGFSQDMLETRVACFSKTDADAFMKRMTDVTLNQLSKQLTFPYSKTLDRYYNPASDTNLTPITAKYGFVSASGIYTIGYTGGLAMSYGWTGSKTLEVSFKIQNNSPVFISNKEAADTDTDASENTVVSAVDYKGVYQPILKKAESSYDGGQYLNYYVYDMNKDGMKELFVLEGTCEADYMYKVYTIADGKAKYLGDFSGWHAEIGVDNAGKLYTCSGYMGGEKINLITYNGNAFTSQNVYDHDIGAGADYDYSAYCTVLPFTEVTDYSLLK